MYICFVLIEENIKRSFKHFEKQIEVKGLFTCILAHNNFCLFV